MHGEGTQHDGQMASVPQVRLATTRGTHSSGLWVWAGEADKLSLAIGFHCGFRHVHPVSPPQG